MTPSQQRQEMVSLIEAYYWKHNKLPKSSLDIDKQFMVETDSDVFIDVLTRGDTLKYMLERGLPVEHKEALSPKQIKYIEAVCNPVDSRPISLKMQDLRISATEVQRWLREPVFSAVLHDEGDKILPQARERILKSLTVEATTGNVTAIKLYLELTGEYKPKGDVTAVGEVRNIMSSILDILQSHVAPKVLANVADEFEYLIINGHRPTSFYREPASPASTQIIDIELSPVDPVEAESSENDLDI